MTTIKLVDLTKKFNGNTVVDRVNLEIVPGRIHVLLGENGAGKSTIIKMISGIYQPDGGHLEIDGEISELPNVKAAQKRGIATIHQELNLVPQLSVAENICLGSLPTSRGLVAKSKMKEIAQRALKRIGLEIKPETRVGDLGIAEQQMVEIAKSLWFDSSVLILDEPTAALTGREIDRLFEIVAELRDSGVAIVFISHHLDEIALIGDDVSVLRDGRLIETVPANTPENELVRLMVGRSLEEQYPRRRTKPGEVRLEVKNLTTPGKFSDISFQVRQGEVLGIAGLVGAGRTEVIRAIAGIDKPKSGQVIINGKVQIHPTIKKAIRAGLGHVPEDRKTSGLVLGASVTENLGLATLFSSAKAGFANLKKQKEQAQNITNQLRIRLASHTQPVKELSGGNQQKVVFGRWINANSNVLLLDEPTRGVDVGAKVEIYELINRITDSGGAVVMVSSELPEVLGMSDRILVMSEGRITGEVTHDKADQETLMGLMLNITERNE